MHVFIHSVHFWRMSLCSPLGNHQKMIYVSIERFVWQNILPRKLLSLTCTFPNWFFRGQTEIDCRTLFRTSVRFFDYGFIVHEKYWVTTAWTDAIQINIDGSKQSGSQDLTFHSLPMCFERWTLLSPLATTSSLQRVSLCRCHRPWSYRKYCNSWITNYAELVASFINLSWTTEHDGVQGKSARSHCQYTVTPYKDLSHNLRKLHFYFLFKAGNTLEHAQVCIALQGTELPRHASVNSTNNLRHTLWTCSCAARTRSDHCQSVKVSIILLCVLSVDSFFTVSVALVMNRPILCYSE